MKTILYSHTLTSDIKPILQPLLSDLTYSHTTILHTAVAYSDDLEMQRLIHSKQQFYTSLLPDSTHRSHTIDFINSSHSIVHHIVQYDAIHPNSIFIVDSLNLYISNMMLLYNTQPDQIGYLKAHIERELLHLVESLPHLKYSHLIFISSEVGYDTSIRTPAGRIYQELICHINSLFLSHQIVQEYRYLVSGSSLLISPPLSPLPTHSPSIPL